ncbi:very short patch repair endonuclease [Aeromicrobium halocynthiae]|uniref:Very short patch repair endonuclease n=1 Tax=Aeromicrobium halocynthiae TaxID=560557 RepID=A0ABN2W0Y6_9ACTN
MSWASSSNSRAIMRANRGRDTKPELAVRRLLHARGLRYRVDARPLEQLNRRADIVFRREMVAIFIDGCYWHGCLTHHTVSKSNAAYWSTKVSDNRNRDADTNLRLVQAGWTIFRAWEHEDVQAVAESIEDIVRHRRIDPTAAPITRLGS